MRKRSTSVAAKQSRESEDMLVHNGFLRHCAVAATGKLYSDERARTRNIAR
jgi:hypothetical protein